MCLLINGFKLVALVVDYFKINTFDLIDILSAKIKTLNEEYRYLSLCSMLICTQREMNTN